MKPIDGIIIFAQKWVGFYQQAISEKITHDDTGEERAIRISPQSHYKTISSIETGFFFASLGRMVVAAEGEVSSAFLVNAEFEEMKQDSLAEITLTSKERKKIKQRIQNQHMTLMTALQHFGLFEIAVRKGNLSNDANWYVITQKGRKVLSNLEKE